MTYAMLLQLLVEAEQRVADESLPADARERSAETVSLCKTRMASEGLTRHQLEQLAAEAA
jgi:hypothetical protein